MFSNPLPICQSPPFAHFFFRNQVSCWLYWHWMIQCFLCKGSHSQTTLTSLLPPSKQLALREIKVIRRSKSLSLDNTRLSTWSTVCCISKERERIEGELPVKCSFQPLLERDSALAQSILSITSLRVNPWMCSIMTPGLMISLIPPRFSAVWTRIWKC
jgi:hypothetical protein